MASPLAEERSTSSLIANVIADMQLLLRDEMRLAKTEISTEITKGKKNLALSTVAIALMIYGVVLLGISLVYLLVAVGLPLWASYGVLAFLFGGGGAAMLMYRQSHQSNMSYIPRETVQNIKETADTVRENVQWNRKPN